MNILLRRDGALGDVLLTTPIAHRLRKIYPDAIIHVHTRFPAAYQNNPHINGIGVPQTMTYYQILNLDMVYENTPTIHQLDAYMLAAFGDTGDEYDKRIVFSIDYNPLQYDWTRVIAIHANVSWKNRTIPREWWGKLVSKLRADGWIVLSLGTSKDHDLSEYGAVDTRDKLSLSKQAAVIRDARLLICGDSMCFTLVGATDTPAIGLCTISKPHTFLPYRYGEMGWKFTAIPANVPCYGCRADAGPVTYLGCKYNHYQCIESFDVDQVFGTALTALG